MVHISFCLCWALEVLKLVYFSWMSLNNLSSVIIRFFLLFRSTAMFCRFFACASHFFNFFFWVFDASFDVALGVNKSMLASWKAWIVFQKRKIAFTFCRQSMDDSQCNFCFLFFWCSLATHGSKCWYNAYYIIEPNPIVIEIPSIFWRLLCVHIVKGKKTKLFFSLPRRHFTFNQPAFFIALVLASALDHHIDIHIDNWMSG